MSLSVFKNLVKNQPERSHHGEWQLEREATDSAIFSFFLGTLKLKFILGHSITSKKEKNIKHWAIRKVSMEVNRHKDADAEIKVCFCKKSVFKKTYWLQSLKSLGFLNY